jgi:hypothetical protein
VLCGDARDSAHYGRLMQNERAVMVVTDPPFNVPVQGHVQGRGRHKHAEFAFASGEMSDTEFRTFFDAMSQRRGGSLARWCAASVFIDWRHVEALIAVSRKAYGAMLNLVVWNKTNASQGSFYRSQHELIGVFRVGEGAHQNNVELGRHGRNRTNIWTYAGVNSFGAGRDDALAMHPTVKPVALVADAMRDCTSKGSGALSERFTRCRLELRDICNRLNNPLTLNFSAACNGTQKSGTMIAHHMAVHTGCRRRLRIIQPLSFCNSVPSAFQNYGHVLSERDWLQSRQRHSFC